jgi:hypothetical protein
MHLALILLQKISLKNQREIITKSKGLIDLIKTYKLEYNYNYLVESSVIK